MTFQFLEAKHLGEILVDEAIKRRTPAQGQNATNERQRAVENIRDIRSTVLKLIKGNQPQ